MTINANSGSRWRLAESERVGGGSPPDDRNASPPRAMLCRQTFSPTPTAKFPSPPWLVRHGGRLIANARLESAATHRKQSTATNSNRERMGISFLSFSLFSSPEPRAPSLRNLIVTPRLEFCATPTKQSSFPISNRYKMHFSPPCCLAATRFTRYNSGSHIEVNQP